MKQSARLVPTLDESRATIVSEERYRTLFESIDQGFSILELIYDEEGKPVDYRFLEVNRAFERETGLAEVAGKLGSEIVPETESHWFAAYDQVVRTGEPLRVENFNQSTGRWFLAYTSRFGGAGSRQICTVFNDVTARKRAEQHQVLLSEISRALVGLENIDVIMNQLAEKIGRYFGAKWAMCAERIDTLEPMCVAYGWHDGDVPSANGTYRIRDFMSEEERASHLRGEVSIVRDTLTGPRIQAESYGARGIRAFITIPLVRDGEWQFQMSIMDRRPRVWRDDEVELMREITARVWTRLERARTEAARRESEAKRAIELADMQQLQRLSSRLIEEDNVNALYEEILQAARSVMRSEMASLQRFVPERNELFLLAQHGFAPVSALFWERVRLDQGSSCALAMTSRGRVIVPDVEGSDFAAGTEDRVHFRLSGIRAIQSTRLVSRSGRLVGVISTHWNEPHEPSERELRLLDVLARQAADLLERHAAQEILRASEEKHRALFDSMDEGYCIIQMIYDEAGRAIDWRFLQVNRAFELNNGLRDAEGKTIRELAPQIEPKWMEIYDRVAQTGEALRFEETSAALKRSFDLYAFRIGDPLERKVAVIFTNVTGRKHADAALREAEDKYRELFESIDQGFCTIEILCDEDDQPVDYRFLVVNPAYERQTGLKDVVGRRVSEVIPSHVAEWPRIYGEIALKGEPRRFQRLVEGLERTFEIYAWRIGRPADRRVAILFDDITDRRNAETAMRESQERLRAANAALQERFGELENASRRIAQGRTAALNLMEDAIQARGQVERLNLTLHESEERFRGVANIVPDLLWSSEPDGQTTWYNDRWMEYTGQTLQQALGWGWVEVIHHEDREASAQGYREAVELSRPLKREHRIRNAAGEYRWFLVRAEPLLDGGGRVVRMYGAAADIHDLREASDALRESEHRLRALADNLPGGAAFVIDSDFRYLLAGGEAFESAGFKAKDFIGRSVSDVMGAKLAVDYGLNYERAFAGHSFSEEHEAHGQVYLTRGGPLRDREGSVVAAIAVSYNITERKRAEEAVRESESRLRTLADSVPQLIWANRAEGAANYFNRRWYDYTGLSFDHSAGHGWQAIVHPDDAASSKEAWRRTLGAGEVFEFEYRLRGADGRYRWFIGRNVPVRDADGRVTGWFGSATDIHDLKQAQAELQEADRRKNHFLAMLGHELRNPLAAIRSGVALLRSEKAKPESRAAALPVVAEQTAHMERLVDDLLDLTRIVQGRVQVDRKRMVIQGALEQAIGIVRAQAEGEAFAIEVQSAEGPLEILGDHVRLTQVFVNILSNAIKFSGQERRIEILVTRRGADAMVRVRDHGQGISADLLPRIFEPFVQAIPGLTLQTGLGLGLAVVRQLVHLHDGEVEAFSAGEQEGSEFIIRIPLVAPAHESSAR